MTSLLAVLAYPADAARKRRNKAASAALRIMPVAEVRRRAYGEGL